MNRQVPVSDRPNSFIESPDGDWQDLLFYFIPVLNLWVWSKIKYIIQLLKTPKMLGRATFKIILWQDKNCIFT